MFQEANYHSKFVSFTKTLPFNNWGPFLSDPWRYGGRTFDPTRFGFTQLSSGFEDNSPLFVCVWGWKWRSKLPWTSPKHLPSITTTTMMMMTTILQFHCNVWYLSMCKYLLLKHPFKYQQHMYPRPFSFARSSLIVWIRKPHHDHSNIHENNTTRLHTTLPTQTSKYPLYSTRHARLQPPKNTKLGHAIHESIQFSVKSAKRA